ncbi:unnamed protein product [Prorocentrum cordatum]|uniref:Uncharacterized protein n=1 Tax=Prorocentrum cordatum TaxID=2364126 RepID=A0ABN9PYI8_9DINO|nr:unnamed protein product [Polarella glacialis]
MRADNHGIRFECFHLLVNSFLGAAVVSEATLVEVFEKLAESIDVPVIQAPDGNEVKDALALAAEIQGSFDVVQRPSVSVYYEMPKYDLAVQMVERDNELTLLQSELKQVKRRLATTEQRLGLHTKKSRILRDTHRSLVQKTNFRPGKRCVSIWGGYHLAYKRSHGCSSARSVVAMCAGEEWQGSFTDGAKNMVIRFEHNLSIARTVVVKSFYDSVNHLHATSNEICINYARAASLDSGDMVALIGSKLFSFEFFMFRGDATNQEAVDKAKVWTGEASYIATCPEALSDISSDTNFDSDDLKLTFFREVLDLQTVRTGGAKETTDLVTRQFRNAGLPTWMEAACRDGPSFRSYHFCLDSGPDCVGLVRAAVAAVSNVRWVMISSYFCRFHQNALIQQSMVDITNNWEWHTPWGSSSFLSGLKVIANTLRGAGVPRKVREAAAELKFPPKVVKESVGNTIHRVIATRWGSVDDIEMYLRNGRHVLGPAVRRTWPKFDDTDADKTKKKTKKLDGEDAEWYEKRRNYRQTTVALLNDKLFLGTAEIDLVAKGPLAHFQRWAQQESKIEREHRSEASKQGTAYTGPTFVSKFVSGKAKVILDEFNALLDDDAMLTHWVGTWSLIRADDVPEHVEEVRNAKRNFTTMKIHQLVLSFRFVFGGLISFGVRTSSKALCLIVTLVVRGALDWERRMYDPTQRFPLDFLNVLEADPEEASAPRKALAHRLMTASKENLEWQDGVYNSFSFKLRAMFYEDFVIMQGTGKCTRMVWIFLSGWRALFNGETQEIEGWNSTLKNMCERAPRTKVRLASDRLKNRVGERTPTDEAVAVHKKVVEFSKTDANMFRFSPLTDKERDASAGPHPDAVPLIGSSNASTTHFVGDLPDNAREALPISYSIFDVTDLGARYAYVIVGPDAPDTRALALDRSVVFLAGTSHYKTMYCATGHVDELCHFHLHVPIVKRTACALVGEALHAFHPLPAGRKQRPRLHLVQYMLSWTSLKAASVIADTAQVTPLFKRAYNGPKKKNTHTVDAEGGLPDMLEDDDGFSEELERLIAQDAMEEECEDLEGASEGLDSDGKDTDVEDDAGDRQPDPHNHAGPDKSDVFDAISGDHRAELLRNVRGACEASRTSARDAMYFAEDYGFRTDMSDAPERGLVSLVELRTVAEDGQVHYDVVFVAWEGVGRSAKIARVDLEHLWFKYNVPFATEHLKRECDRDHCNIIIGNVPVRITRPKDLRERVPDWCLLIMKAFAAELFSGPIARDCLFSCDAPCVFCACADTMGMDVRVVGGGGAQPVEHFDSYICSECVVYWHSACAENVARAFGMGLLPAMAAASSHGDMALVPKGPEPKIADPSTLFLNDRARFPTIYDRFVGYVAGPELENLVFRLYARQPRWLPLVHEGKFTMTRDPANRCKSVETIGICKVRKGPWVIPAGENQWTVLHWASLLEGAKMAMEKDPHKKNRTVWIALEAGCDSAVEFDPNLPDDVKDYVIELGNATNASTLVVTVLQVFMSTETILSGWAIQKEKVTATGDGCGGALTLYARRHAYANTVFSGRWRSQNALDVTINTYNLLQTTMTSAGISIWDQMVSYFETKADYMHEYMKDTNAVIQNISCICKVLCSTYPDFVVPVVALVIPHLESEPLGACPALPDGIPQGKLRKLSEAMVRNLLASMADSATMKAKVSAGCACASDGDNDVSFLSDVIQFTAMLKHKLNVPQDNLNAYSSILCFCQLQGEIQVPGNGNTPARTISRYTAMKRHIINAAFKASGMAKKPSDLEIYYADAGDDSQLAESPSKAPLEEKTDETLLDTFKTLQDNGSAARMKSYLMVNPIDKPIQLHMAVCGITSKVYTSMIGACGGAEGKSGTPDSQRELIEEATKRVVTAVMDEMPLAFDEIVINFGQLSEFKFALTTVSTRSDYADTELLRKTCEEMGVIGATGRKKLNMVRLNTFFAVCSTLSTMQVPLNGTPKYMFGLLSVQDVFKKIAESIESQRCGAQEPIDIKIITKAIDGDVSMAVFGDCFSKAFAELVVTVNKVCPTKAKAHHTLVAGLRGKLQGFTHTQMKEFVVSQGLQSIEVPPSMGIFSSVKAALVEDVMTAVKKKCTDTTLAATILVGNVGDKVTILRDQLAKASATTTTAAATAAVVAPTAGQTTTPTKTAKEPVPIAVDDGKGIPQGDFNLTSLGVTQWISMLTDEDRSKLTYNINDTSFLLALTSSPRLSSQIREELKSNGPDHLAMTSATKARVIASVQGHFMPPADGLQGRFLRDVLIDFSRKKSVGTLTARLAADATTTEAPEFVCWGRVVDAIAARSLPRGTLLPLGTSNGLSLFLDGSKLLNPLVSDACIAWMLPMIKDDVDGETNADAAPLVDSAANPEAGACAAGSSSGAQPPSKKRKGASAAKAQQAQQAAPPAKPQPKKAGNRKKLSHTHSVEFETVQFDVEVDSTAKVFTFERPFLKSNRPLKAGETLRRKAFEWTEANSPGEVVSGRTASARIFGMS